MNTNDWLLFVLTALSAFMGVNFGGTMLLIVPLLLGFGYSPLLVLSSTRPAVIAQSLVGMHMFRKHRDMKLRQELMLLVAAGIGGFTGVSLLSQLSKEQGLSLMIILVMLLVAVALYKRSAFGIPKAGKATSQTQKNLFIYFIVGFSPSIIGGLVGAGAGPIVVLLSFLILKKSTYATAYLEKFASFGHASVVLVWALFYGTFDIKISLIMLVGTLIGAYLGARLTLKLNPYWMYAVIVILCASLMVKHFLL